MITVFLDTSALIAGLASSARGAREILKLGEGGVVRLIVSSQVLTELDEVLRRKLPEVLGVAAETLIRANVESLTLSSKTPRNKRLYAALPYAPDRVIAAAAIEAHADYFATFDRKHLLGNAALAEVVPFPLGTAGDFLAWFRERLSSESQ